MANTQVNYLSYFCQGDGSSLTTTLNFGFTPTSITFISASITSTGVDVSSNISSVIQSGQIATVTFNAAFSYLVTIVLNVYPVVPPISVGVMPATTTVNPTQSDIVGSTTALNTLNASASVQLSGASGTASSVGFFLAAGTLAATLTPEVSYDGGTTWVSTFFDNPSTRAKTTTLVVTNPNSATSLTIVPSGGASSYRVRVSSFTSGTANGAVRGTNIEDNSSASFNSAIGGALPPTVALTGGSVTTSAPSYSTATANALSLNTSGGPRTDGSGVTQPVNWTQLNGVALGSPSNYGTSPGAVAVEGVNAFITNTPAVTISSGTVTTVSTVTAVTTVNASRTVGNAGATLDAAIGGAASTNALWTEHAPATASAAACTATFINATGAAVSIKASAGNLYGLSLTNNTAAVAFIEFFNTASAPTLGTTAVVFAIPIPANGNITLTPAAFALMNFTTGIGFAVTTTENGSTTASVTGMIFFK